MNEALKEKAPLPIDAPQLTVEALGDDLRT
jgi:hypothetical protein